MKHVSGGNETTEFGPQRKLKVAEIPVNASSAHTRITCERNKSIANATFLSKLWTTYFNTHELEKFSNSDEKLEQTESFTSTHTKITKAASPTVCYVNHTLFTSNAFSPTRGRQKIKEGQNTKSKDGRRRSFVSFSKSSKKREELKFRSCVIPATPHTPSHRFRDKSSFVQHGRLLGRFTHRYLFWICTD